MHCKYDVYDQNTCYMLQLQGQLFVCQKVHENQAQHSACVGSCLRGPTTGRIILWDQLISAALGPNYYNR